METNFLANQKILVVDDKEDNVVFLELLLKREGFTQVKSTTDPRKVTSLVENEQPDIILLDLMMPHMDGFEVIAQIKPTLAKDEYLPILVLTADSNKEARRRALSEGAMDFLLKPLDATEVIQRTKNLLHTRHLHQKQRLYSEKLEDAVKERTEELDKTNLELSKANKSLENASNEILDRLARAAEYRDDNTGQHTYRVGHLSQQIAQGLNLPDEFCQLSYASCSPS